MEKNLLLLERFRFEMDMSFDRKDAADWSYRGEGAVNLVLAYIGASPAFLGKVMRIQKAPTYGYGKKIVDCSSGLTDVEKLLWRDEKILWRDDEELIASASSKEVVDRLFVKHVISPLIGPKHVDPGVHVLVSREFLESVEKNAIRRRPCWRVDAARVDLHRNSVLLMNDHSLFSYDTRGGETCISIEIKPKCGFLPVSQFISEENAIKRSVSRFRMHQVLKLQENTISELSEYDPLDLFSGSKDRIFRAIKALYATPQNNFRVFLNGSLILGGLGGGTGSTTVAIGKTFEDDIAGVIRADKGLRTNSFMQLVADLVHSSGVLDRLLDVQKLDNLDIEGAIHAYYDIISQPCLRCRELDKDNISPRYTALHSLPLDESLKIVKGYLIAATAKDCSMMISFRPREAKHSGSSYKNVHLASTNQTFDYKVHFIDLDLKPLKKMEKYFTLDQKIVSCYKQFLETRNGYGGTCSDTNALL